MENAEKSTTMTDVKMSTLVFKDQAGEYYLLPQATLEQGRVPQEHQAEVERLIAASDDVAGYKESDPVRVAAAYFHLAAVMFGEMELLAGARLAYRGLSMALYGKAGPV